MQKQIGDPEFFQAATSTGRNVALDLEQTFLQCAGMNHASDTASARALEKHSKS